MVFYFSCSNLVLWCSKNAYWLLCILGYQIVLYKREHFLFDKSKYMREQSSMHYGAMQCDFHM